MRTRPSRFVGLLFSILVLGALMLYFRAGRESPLHTASPPAQRGGQLVAAIPAAPVSFNRLAADDEVTHTISLLTQGTLVRVNGATFELEPWLAERWEASPDRLTYTLHLREGLAWSDGTPFTAADVVFSLEAAFDPRVASPVAPIVAAGGQPTQVVAPDARTVLLTYSAPPGPGLGLLDSLPILPRHKLETALASGTFAAAWGPGVAPEEVVGMGPFVLRELASERVVLERNPRYWRTAGDGAPLPYLDRLVLDVIADPDAEFERLAAGTLDLPHAALRPAQLALARRAELEGRLQVTELGVATGADALWFCLDPAAKQRDPRFAFVRQPEFRQALSHAIDREDFAQRVLLGEGVPVWGPITPGNRPWFSPDVPRYPHDVARARALLQTRGLDDRDGNGIVEDAAGIEARFSLLIAQGDPLAEQGGEVLREHAALAGIAFDIVPLEAAALEARLAACEYDAAFMRRDVRGIDPAVNLDFWLSSGSAHLWHRAQPAPATEWEQEIDQVMREQARTPDPERRRLLVDHAQRVLAEHVPVLYIAAPRLFYASAPRVGGLTPSVLTPPVLWSADTLGVAAP